ncbi:MAG: hypothetical protein WD187_02935 [Candidatus Woykebacteria bacterium]
MIISEGTETTDSVYTFEEIASELEKYLPNTTTALKVVLATATSAIRENRVLLWVLLVGSPSSGKTDLVELIKNSKFTYHLDNLTLNSFISGERDSKKGDAKVYDLLPELNKKCLVIKDWTVIFSLDERMTKKIIGDLVGAYDKTLSKFSSRRGIITYNAEFSQLGCITPATLNRHGTYLNMIGPRFLSYSIPELTKADEDMSFEAIFRNDESRRETKKKLSGMICTYLDQLSRQDISQLKPLSKEVKDYLSVAARFVARARGILIIKSASFENDEGKNVTYYELQERQIEQPWRAVQQLMFLAQSLAIVLGHEEVGSDELEVVKDVVVSSMPADRAQALKVLKETPDHELTAKQLADDKDFGRSDKTARRLLDELAYLELVKKEKGAVDRVGKPASNYSLDNEFKDFVALHPREFLSLIKTEPKDELRTNNPDSVPQTEKEVDFKKLDSERLKVLRRNEEQWFDNPSSDVTDKQFKEKSEKLQLIIDELERRSVEEAVETFSGSEL